jgi:hypothetical protein
MAVVVEKHLGRGEYERIGTADVDMPLGADPAAPAFHALDVTEVAEYRVYPEGAEESPGFYRLTMSGAIVKFDSPTP